jgi:hypothetical protein
MKYQATWRHQSSMQKISIRSASYRVKRKPPRAGGGEENVPVSNESRRSSVAGTAIRKRKRAAKAESGVEICSVAAKARRIGAENIVADIAELSYETGGVSSMLHSSLSCLCKFLLHYSTETVFIRG